MRRRLLGSDLSDPASTDRRAKVLRAVRGYPDQFLFTRFPSDMTWKLAKVTVGELGLDEAGGRSPCLAR